MDHVQKGGAAPDPNATPRPISEAPVGGGLGGVAPRGGCALPDAVGRRYPHLLAIFDFNLRPSNRRGDNSSKAVPSLEAGVESWQLAAPLSRETVTTDHGQLRILGGLTPSGSSIGNVTSLDPATGTFTASGSLPAVVHDGGGATLGTSAFLFGGGSPNTFATVQSVGLPIAVADGRRSGPGGQPAPSTPVRPCCRLDRLRWIASVHHPLHRRRL